MPSWRARPGRAEPRLGRLEAHTGAFRPLPEKRCASATASSCSRSTSTRRRSFSASSPWPAWPISAAAGSASPARPNRIGSRRSAASCANRVRRSRRGMRSGISTARSPARCRATRSGCTKSPATWVTMPVNWGVPLRRERRRVGRLAERHPGAAETGAAEARAGDLERRRVRDPRRDRLQRRRGACGGAARVHDRFARAPPEPPGRRLSWSRRGSELAQRCGPNAPSLEPGRRAGRRRRTALETDIGVGRGRNMHASRAAAANSLRAGYRGRWGAGRLRRGLAAAADLRTERDALVEAAGRAARFTRAPRRR